MSDVVDGPAVQQWIKSVDMGEDDGRLDVLAAFCDLVGASPDDLVERCLADVGDGQKKIRMKQRRIVAEQIEEFEARPDGRRQGNVVRSFFIHNGVSMQVRGILR